MTSSHASVRSASEAASVSSIPEMVPWGGASYCVDIRRSNLDAMRRVTKDVEWVNLFLDGVFAEDPSIIPHLRAKKTKNSNENTIVIPSQTMAIAKDEYRKWLLEQGVVGLDADRRVRNFGGKFGDVCTDRSGPRSFASKIRRRLGAGENVADLVAAQEERKRRRSAPLCSNPSAASPSTASPSAPSASCIPAAAPSASCIPAAAP
ncbi:SWI5-dependent HO expression protein 3, partial [Frankliniella fusca]